MPETFYPDWIYPFQDKILQAVEAANLDFYLTGGTALGRCYLGHRYSDDLDFFVNDHKEFKKQCAFAVDIFKNNWTCNIETTSATFVRLFVIEESKSLKVDFVNDIPMHYGTFKHAAIFHRVDNWRNILSNKLCALSRLEAKDMADILFIAYQYDFEWEDQTHSNSLYQYTSKRGFTAFAPSQLLLFMSAANTRRQSHRSQNPRSL